MLILSEDLCTRFKFINLHPALPDGPKGTWEQVITQLIKNDQNYSGLNVHIVTKKLDAGKSIGYCKFPIKSNMHNDAWQQFYLESKKNFKNIIYEDLDLFREIDSPLQGHPDKLRLPALDATTGSLGQGLSIAIGHSIGQHLRNVCGTVFCVLGDGELQEGQVWELSLIHI